MKSSSLSDFLSHAQVIKTVLRNRIKNKRLIFFHAPRCGGTSVSRILSHSFGFRRALTHKGIIDVDSGATRRASETMDTDIQALREQIVIYCAQMTEAVYIGGHIPYSTFLDKITPEPWNYVTILRDPESRLLSHYYYNAHKPQQEHFGIDVGLEEFLESSAGRSYGNNYVRIFMGECAAYEARGDLNVATMRTDETIAKAKRNLDKFAVIGSTKSLPSFEAAMLRHFGATIKIPHVNQNPAKKYPSLKDLPENVRKKIEEICAPDREVFEHAFKNSPGRAI